jgi:hypothetical protein
MMDWLLFFGSVSPFLYFNELSAFNSARETKGGVSSDGTHRSWFCLLAPSCPSGVVAPGFYLLAPSGPSGVVASPHIAHAPAPVLVQPSQPDLFPLVASTPKERK